jgi:hypothetical protein
MHVLFWQQQNPPKPTYNMTTKNETILIDWNNILFSENIFAWFEYGMYPVLSQNLEDLMLPDDYTFELHASGAYEIFAYDAECEEYLYTGRLFTPKDKPLVD